MRQSTTTACTQDSTFPNLGVLIDDLFASTAMEVDCSYPQEDFDNESISEDQTDVFRKLTSSICFDFPPPQQHFVAELDDESCSSNWDETQANVDLKSPQFSFSTEFTAIMTWDDESCFDDMDDDSLSNEIRGMYQIFEPNDAQFHSNSFREESTRYSIFRPKEDRDFERKEQYANIVRMKSDNYQHEQPQARKSSVLTSTLNRRPNSPTQLKYPDEKGKEEVRRQFLRQHAAEQQIYRAAQKHNLVMSRAA